MTRSMALRLLCGAWLVPAASLIWIGLATTGLRHVGDSSLAIALGRTQALAVLLAVFTALIGANVCVRHPRPLRPARGDRSGLWLLGHGAALSLAAPALLLGAVAESLAPLLWPLAAVAGFAAGLGVPRALLRIPGVWSGPLAALSVGVTFQVTIGWLHLIHPAALASPVLIAEGVVLAWAAASAARVEPFMALAPVPLELPSPLLASVAEQEPAPPVERVERVASRSGFVCSPPASRSFAEPLAGP